VTTGVAGTPVPTRRGSDYAVLLHTVRAAGLLDRRPLSYAVRIVLTLMFYAATWLLVVRIGNSWVQLAAAPLLAISFGQVAFLGHDAGHQAIFAGRRLNDALGRSLGNVLVGLSFGWWVDTHNRHHANPNDVTRDPDIEDGVLTYTPAQATKRGGALSRFIARRQAWLFFPLLTLQGISMHVDSVVAVKTDEFRSVRGGTRRYEAIGLVLHAAMYVTALLLVMSPAKALTFAAIHQAVFGIYMGCSFAPNHKGMPFIEGDDRPDYLRRQVLTSRNVRGNAFIDLALGGLNYQIEHHLFPNMPRASLRRTRPIVQAYCRELDVSYVETSLLGSYRAVLAHLDAMGAPLREATRQPARAGELQR
jgi:fatty acid desaturase